MKRSWLEKYNQPQTPGASPLDEFDAFMRLSNDPPVAFDEDQAWDRVSTRLSITPANKTAWFAPIYKVAAVLVLAAISFLFYQVTDNESPNLVEISTEATPLNYELPDGSKIYLDVNSSLSFYDDFTERVVSFEGRGYYDVVKGNSTFVVQMQGLNVTVLGTAFSLETSGDYFLSYVEEGLVEVSDKHSAQKIKPGEILTYQKDSRRFNVQENENPNILAWKTGKFIFRNTPFDEVARNLGKYYKIDFHNADRFKNCTVTAEFNQQKLSEVLAVLGEILDLEFKISNTEVKTLGKGCQ